MIHNFFPAGKYSSTLQLKILLTTQNCKLSLIFPFVIHLFLFQLSQKRKKDHLCSGRRFYSVLLLCNQPFCVYVLMSVEVHFKLILYFFVPTQELQTYPQSPSIVIIFYLIYYDFYIGLLTFFASKSTYELSYNVWLTQSVQIMSVLNGLILSLSHKSIIYNNTRSYLINCTALASSLL